jgi:hypothetical protein
VGAAGWLWRSALQELQRHLRLGVGLREHRADRLLQDRVARQPRRLVGDVGVADARLGGRQVLGGDADRVDRDREAVLHGAEVAARGADGLDRRVDAGDRGRGRATGADVERGERQRRAPHHGQADGQLVDARRGADADREVQLGDRAVEQARAREAGRAADAVDLGEEVLELLVEGLLVLVADRAVARLDRQFAQSGQDRADFVQRAFGGLHQRDAVVGVALGLVERPDLRAQALADGETSGVVGRGRDAEARRQATEVAGDVVRHRREVALGVDRRGVRVDPESHVASP